MLPYAFLMLMCLVGIFPMQAKAGANPFLHPHDDWLWTAQKDALEDDCDAGVLCTPETPPFLVFDRPRDDPDGYSRLRTTRDAVSADVDVQGLAPLNASGSSQFTRAGLGGIVKALMHRGLMDAPAQMTVFDLRYEPHGEAGDHAVSWHVWSNWLNRDTPWDRAQADEAERLKQLAQAGPDVGAYRICKQRTETVKQVYYHPDRLVFASTSTEQQSVLAQGLQYVRLPMADHTGAPTDTAVERFVESVRARPAAQWWHFHCRKGVGRTTLFMAMLDMIHNAPDVPLATIAARHVALSDVDILGTSAHEPHKSCVRRQFARDFHAYCAAGMPGRWSAWPRAKT